MQNNQTGKKKLSAFLKNQGFYVVLAVCLIIIGAAVTILALPNNETAEQETDPSDITIVGSSQDETLSGKVTAPSAAPTKEPYSFVLPSSSAMTDTSHGPTPSPTPKTTTTSSKASAPVAGAVVWSFAKDKLIYSKTLDQWTTHEGVDISAALGTDVKCVMGGVVAKVYQDDSLGFTIIVEHSNDRMSLYAALGSDIRVKEGDKVNAGTVIGSVGNSAITECASGPHLHFAFYVDGIAVDPAKYVKLG